MLLKVFAFLVVSFFQPYSFAQEATLVSKAELALLPPYCTAVFGKFHGMPSSQDSPLRHTIPAGCPVLHHYCDGLKYLVRADRTMGKKEITFGYGYNIQSAISHFEGVIDDWRKVAPSCSLRAEAHTNLAKALLRQRKSGAASKAINSLNQAIELAPEFLQSYLTLADVYIDNGQKGKAKGIVEEGLVHIPNSKALAKRYVGLGGNLSTIKPVTKPVLATVEENVTTDKASQPIEVKPIETKPIETKPIEEKPAELKSESNTGSESPTPKIGSQKSPYCRFCPED